MIFSKSTFRKSNSAISVRIRSGTLLFLGGRDRCKPVAKNCFRARGSDIFADDVRQALVTSDEELPVDSLDGLVPPENSCYLQERDVGGCRGLSRGSF